MVCFICKPWILSFCYHLCHGFMNFWAPLHYHFFNYYDISCHFFQSVVIFCVVCITLTTYLLMVHLGFFLVSSGRSSYLYLLYHLFHIGVPCSLSWLIFACTLTDHVTFLIIMDMNNSWFILVILYLSSISPLSHLVFWFQFNIFV